MRDAWRYEGPFFDAHTHIGSIEELQKMITIENDYGVSAQIGILHNQNDIQAIKEKYPERFIFAKYLSLKDFAQYNIDSILDQISSLLDQGYSLAKSWFGPRWRDYYDVPKDFRINHPKLELMFQALEENKIPLIIHMGDPDTYYATHYRDERKYGTKDEHLNQLEDVLAQHKNLFFQIPHFGSQPEIERLPHLIGWMDKYPNFVVDTASSRWMARELSKDVKVARDFMVKYSDRVLFGTDLFANRGDREYYSGRYFAQRVLWETNERSVPLPFTDVDTVETGGTFINGLALPQKVLRKLYWVNAKRLYMN